ncbi:type III secretion protein HrpB4 [Caballeronia sp. LZ035]|uniref:type III secretion protein HrpB4 n=1 Tax=Caballeronia sp. LZ035 TaxID=3038568 RepID=UPI00285B4540|nr:type III secretion protein HrpB4 [Caballeronia sp. LZ035]MDR5759453.1 type III secretion protein HrpB4 [Caballeronia sp. LZ035]
MHVNATPARRIAAALNAWQDNARNALSWAHGSWPAGVLSLSEDDCAALTSAVASVEHREACSLAFLASAQIGSPSLEGPFLDALPIEIGLRVLRLRALQFRRGEIRRIVDKRTRMSVLHWAGVSSLEHITRDALVAPDIARLSIPPVAMLDADALALEGLALIARDTSSSCALLRCALPRASAHASWVGGVPRALDQHGTQALIAQLPELLPEWSWLFG